MTIKKRLAIYLFIPFLLLTGILAWLAQDLVYRGFDEVEQTEAHEDLKLINGLIESELQDIAAQTGDWGSWDDTYYWIKGTNPTYLAKNYYVDTTYNLQMNYAAMTDIQGKLLISFKFNLKDKKITNAEKAQEEIFSGLITETFKNSAETTLTGIKILDNDAWFYAVKKVTDSDLKFKPNGYLIFVRSAKEQLLEKFTKIVKYELRFHNTEKSNQEQQYQVDAPSHKELILTLRLPVQHGDKVGHFSFIKDRKIFQTGQLVFWQLIIGMSVLILMIASVVYATVSFSIVKKLKIMGNRISSIQKSEHLNERIEVSQNDEIAELGLAMNKMLDRIALDQIEINRASRMNSLNQLASGVAHEVNNPLNIILGSASLMSRKIEIITSGQSLSIAQINKELEDIKKFSGKIKATAVRIAHIVQSLRSLAKEDFFEESQVTQPQQVVEVMMSLCEARMKENEINFEVEYSDTDLKFMSRPMHLNKVMLLLISNCFDALQNTENKWIRISFKASGSFVRIEITDSGSGIAKDDQAKLFTPFFTTKPTGSGTGLGLSVAKGLIESQNGRIYLDASQANTTFVIELAAVSNLAASA